MPESGIPLDEYSPPPNQTLSLIEINLQHFSDRPLDEQALLNTDRILTYFTKQRQGIILRFLYDWDGLGIQHEPHELSTILMHLEQLSPLLHAHADALYVFQGLMTGSWGEMHNTRYTDESDLLRLSLAAAAATDEQTFLAVRCPNIWRSIFRSFSGISLKEAFSGNPRARFGLFNDAILASETDLGTYGNLSFESASRPSDKLNRHDELRFQSNLCRYVPNGGEALQAASPLTDFQNAVKTFRAMRLTYLNGSYDPAVLDKWRRQPATDQRAAYRNQTGYNFISGHLGYRYLITSAAIESHPRNAPSRVLTVTIENSGFAPCYRALTTELLLEGNGMRRIIPVAADTRAWLPLQPVTLKIPVNTDGLQGRFLVSLRLSCPLTGHAVRLANTPASNTIGEWLI